MAGVDGEGWIRTERTHWAVFTPMLVGVVGIVTYVLAEWFTVLGPYGLVFTIASLAVLSGVVGTFEAWWWTQTRPVAIRVAPAQVDVKRRFRGIRSFTPANATLTAFEGVFGFLKPTASHGIFLSPRQFDAARSVLPLDANPGTRAEASPR